MAIFYRDDLPQLKAQGCATPGCTHNHGDEMCLMSPCCEAPRLVVAVHFKREVVVVICPTCDREILEIPLASRPSRVH